MPRLQSVGRSFQSSSEVEMHSIQEVSKRLGISRSLVYAEIHAGNLHAHRFGKRTYRVSDEDLASYVEQHGHTALLPKEVTSPAAKAAAEGGDEC